MTIQAKTPIPGTGRKKNVKHAFSTSAHDGRVKESHRSRPEHGRTISFSTDAESFCKNAPWNLEFSTSALQTYRFESHGDMVVNCAATPAIMQTFVSKYLIVVLIRGCFERRRQIIPALRTGEASTLKSRYVLGEARIQVLSDYLQPAKRTPASSVY